MMTASTIVAPTPEPIAIAVEPAPMETLVPIAMPLPVATTLEDRPIAIDCDWPADAERPIATPSTADAPIPTTVASEPLTEPPMLTQLDSPIPIVTRSPIAILIPDVELIVAPRPIAMELIDPALVKLPIAVACCCAKALRPIAVAFPAAVEAPPPTAVP
jgi:hypothetical protein